jgi:hypothetical protein
VGAGGGMKGAVNIWKALRDNASVHPAWRHLNGKAYVEADMPRRINEKGDTTGLKSSEGGALNNNNRAGISAAVEDEANIEGAELGVAAL